MIPLVDTVMFWPLVFVIGAVSFGLYSVALVELSERFSGAMLVAGNSAFAMMFGVGGLAGPSETGAVMDAIGPNGLPLSLGVIGFALAVFALAAEGVTIEGSSRADRASASPPRPRP